MALLFMASLSFAFFCGGTSAVQQDDTRLVIGQSEFRVLRHSNEPSRLQFFNMHDDENTAVEAALDVIGRRGGSLIELRHSGERLGRFQLNGEEFTFDPNRIFTAEGARRTLESNGVFDQAAWQALQDFAGELISRFELDRGPLIVTVHNNTDEAYSVLSYSNGGAYSQDASRVHIESGRDEDDFFFVTEARLFEYFQKAGYNVVLQDNQEVTDDGSLSVLAAREGIPYINVEAQHNHLSQQIRMLEEVYAAYQEEGVAHR